MSKILNPDWRYTSAADSSKPGYLKRKFEKLRKQQEQNKAEAEAKVRIILPNRKMA